MIHAQQKGYQPPEVLKGLCNAVVRNYRGTITKGKEIGERVAFIGGVAANRGAVAALREAFEIDEEHLIVPAYYAWMGAIGARPHRRRRDGRRGDGHRRRRPTGRGARRPTSRPARLSPWTGSSCCATA